ncbi:MAG: GNAT family N-acetyltransferase [Sphingomonas sp.]
MSAVPLPIKFQIGARTLLTIERRLVRLPLSLADALSGAPPLLPALPPGAHGYAITSLPVVASERLAMADPATFGFVRQRYTRRYTGLTGGFEAFFAGLSSNARSAAKRKARRLAEHSGGALDVRRFRTPDELAQFHPVARALAERTYQQRLMGAGLPADDRFVTGMYEAAAAGRVRAWLLYVAGAPAAYLYCPVEGGTVRYDYVGHAPEYAELSPGAVLQIEAFRDLFAEGSLCLFDFTEGDGQHKRQFASGGVDCVDLLLLRRTVGNAATVAALSVFDQTMAIAKRATAQLGLEALARRLRR